MTPQSMKRISKVVIKHIFDESPDTSYIGEYSDKPASEYAIDRAHRLDCASQAFNAPSGEGLRILESANSYINNLYNDLQDKETKDDAEEDRLIDLDDADTILTDLRTGTIECDCGERGSMGHNELRYFNGPIENYKGESPEDIRKYVLQDYKRMESLNNQQWYYLGIRADAQVHLNGDLFQEITSGGLWGIESDMDRKELESIEQEQLSELRNELHAIGFSNRAITAAFRNVEVKDRT